MFMIIQDISAYKLVVYDDSGNTWFRHVGFFCSYSQTETDFSIGARALNAKLIVLCGGGGGCCLYCIGALSSATVHEILHWHNKFYKYLYMYNLY